MATPRIDTSKDRVSGAVTRAALVLEGAQTIRAEHRRRNRDDRLGELVEAIGSINDSTRELRSLVIAASRRDDVPQAARLVQLSRELQAERRKLRKMLAKTEAGVASLEGGWS